MTDTDAIRTATLDLPYPGGAAMIRANALRSRHSPVIPISLPYVFRLAEELDPLTRIQSGTSILDNFYVLISSRLAIDGLLNQSVFATTLRSCRETGGTLLKTIDDLINNPNSATILQPYQPITISQQLGQFKTALLAEIGVLPSYFVTQKAGYDTLTLLNGGQLLFPAELHQKAPEAVFDVQGAAKALAYELPTSCGFHAFRGTESVLRRYYTHVTSGAPPPKVRNIGVYIKAMRIAKCGDEIILASLEQLTKLHRNPLIHPEVVLTLDEAISTLGMARSVVAAMLTGLPVLAPTTASP